MTASASTLSIADKGKPGHFGLQGMQERAVRIEGKLTIASAETSGTTINLARPRRHRIPEGTTNTVHEQRAALILRRERAPSDVERLG